MNKTILSKEENLLIEILFKKKKSIKFNYNSINYESFVKIASSHLMLPALYLNIQKKKYSNRVPKNLIKYLEEIYRLNYERNEILIDEIKDLSKILDHNKIKHVFLKGSAHIISNIYFDIGERMVGDIDFLIHDNDKARISKLLYNNGYKDFSDYSFFEFKHLTRKIHKNKIFAIEPHIRLFNRENNLLNINNLFKNKLIINGICVPNIKSQFIHNIYNYQINDYGSDKLLYSYRSIYDTFKIFKTNKLNINNIKLDNHKSKYFIIAEEIGIPKFIHNLNLEKYKVDIKRFRLKKMNKTYFYIDNFFVKFFHKIKVIPKQIIELLINKKYREYGVRKLFRKI